jgi:hypothetical protein
VYLRLFSLCRAESITIVWQALRKSHLQSILERRDGHESKQIRDRLRALTFRTAFEIEFRQSAIHGCLIYMNTVHYVSTSKFFRPVNEGGRSPGNRPIHDGSPD